MSSLDTPPTEKPVPDAGRAAVPRKRRRRAAATGATEDCFTCRKRQTKCDRRRPYCSQCLEIGNECSGYRTTLTWGVGVASRGKLRGLSLPVVNSSTRASTSTQETKTTPKTSSSNSAVLPLHFPVPDVGIKPEPGPFSPPSASHPSITGACYETLHLNGTGPIPIPSTSTTPFGWHVPGFNEHVESFNASTGKHGRAHFRPRPLERLQTSLSTRYDESGMSAPSTGSLGTFSDSDFPSPCEFPQTPDAVTFSDPFLYPYPDSYILQDPLHSTERCCLLEVPRSYPVGSDDMSSSIGSDQSSHDFSDYQSIHSGVFSPSSHSSHFHHNIPMDDQSSFHSRRDSYEHRIQWQGSQPMSPDTNTTVFHHSPTISRLPHILEPLSFYHLDPRMQFLLEYYDKAICPVLVAYDGPSNPYRMHVMHLAMRSEGLQNAIAALSTNNIRMRGLKDVSRLGFKQGNQPHLTADEIKAMAGSPSPEEVQYRSTSIALLNTQLASAVSARDDSVLATLLILCLFHVCDSGFAKFTTQLAGVQKLLALRNRSERVQSNFVGWIEMFFTWFDVMTSTCNDRETEMHSDCLDMLNLTTNLGALEHLAGCEGRLFKLISRLGRLNLLSQNRPVRDESPPHVVRQTPPPRTPSTTKDFYSLDLNGWPTSSRSVAVEPPHSPFPDLRHDFWTEWRLIRRLLEDWSPHPRMPLDQPDPSLLHISNAFRYSALLYTERLASPSLPPSARTLQSLVAASLTHLRQIPPSSCMNKFLLWPLFVTGTECVHGADRQLVRARIGEVMRESGFFNNLSGLEVLERVWAEDDERARVEVSVAGALAEMQSGLGPASSQAFRWRKAMEGRQGEYIVV